MNGYKIIDFKGENLDEGHVPGIWNAITTANKPLVFYNYCVGDSDTIQKPFFAGFGFYRGVTAGVYGYDYMITEADGGIVKLTIMSNDNIAIGA